MRTWVIEQPEQRERFAAFVARLPLDRPQEITVREFVPKRSSEQNARLWKLHSMAAEVVGCGAEEMHEEMLCEHFGANEIHMPNGSIRRVPVKRSSGRNKREFSAFMEFVEAFYAERLGVWL